MRNPIVYTAQGITVTLYTDGWPRQPYIRNEDGHEIKLFGTDQIRALHWALGEILAADPMPDDRPQKPT